MEELYDVVYREMPREAGNVDRPQYILRQQSIRVGNDQYICMMLCTIFEVLTAC